MKKFWGLLQILLGLAVFTYGIAAIASPVVPAWNSAQLFTWADLGLRPTVAIPRILMGIAFSIGSPVLFIFPGLLNLGRK